MQSLNKKYESAILHELEEAKLDNTSAKAFAGVFFTLINMLKNETTSCFYRSQRAGFSVPHLCLHQFHILIPTIRNIILNASGV